MSIRFVKGDMFESHYDYRINTVNCYGIMGKGIALDFKNRYPEMFRAYKIFCKQGKLKPGILHCYENVINFPTKIHWRNPSEYAYIRDGLLVLRHHLINNCDNNTKIAIPRLGCNLGGLDWKIVKKMILEYLQDLDVTIDVYEN